MSVYYITRLMLTLIQRALIDCNCAELQDGGKLK